MMKFRLQQRRGAHCDTQLKALRPPEVDTAYIALKVG